MKKILALVLALMMMLSAASVLAEDTHTVKMGMVYAACNGTNGFTIVTVAMEGDVIVGAYIDEVQPMDAASVAVPNSDSTFPELAAATNVLASKRVNDEAYSAMMANYAGSTVTIVNNFIALQDFCVGKTIAELEAALNGKTAEEVVDAVSGATLVNSQLYLQAIIEAAKAAK